MSSCVFAGSFDPVTVGHMDVIGRAAAIFEKVHVTVMVNIHKQGALPADERIRLLEKACARFDNVEVDRWEGLLAEYMREHQERILIRGVRSCSEFEHEYDSALINKKLNGEFETLLIPSDPGLAMVSSSAVREIASFGGELKDLVPKECLKDIRIMLSKKK